MTVPELLPSAHSTWGRIHVAPPRVWDRMVWGNPTWTVGSRGRHLRWRSARCTLAALAALLATAGTACVQVTTPERVLSERLCTECTITLDTVLSIPRGAVSDQLFLAMGPDGTVVGVDLVLNSDRVLLFGPDGGIAAHADISHMVLPGIPFFSVDGDVLVPDEQDGVFQMLTPSLEPVRSFMTVDRPQTGIVLSGGTMVVNALSATAERAGYALHVLKPGDERVTSMDTGANIYELRRFLAPRDGTSFWSLHTAEYMIDLWDTSGRRIESLRRDAPWFVKRTTRSLARLTPPPTDPKGLAADSDGLLWVLFSVADSEWVGYESPGQGLGQHEERAYPGRNRHLEDGVFDSVLEVVDPELGAVIARARYDEYFFGFAGPQVVVHYDGSSNDTGSYMLLRLSLTRADEAR